MFLPFSTARRLLSVMMQRPAARLLSRSALRPLAGRSLATHAAPKRDVRIVEVGPRDGLQNEKGVIPVATKIELVRRLAGTGLQTIEAGSFVSPKWTPQVSRARRITLVTLHSHSTITAPIVMSEKNRSIQHTRQSAPATTS